LGRADVHPITVNGDQREREKNYRDSDSLRKRNRNLDPRNLTLASVREEGKRRQRILSIGNVYEESTLRSSPTRAKMRNGERERLDRGLVPEKGRRKKVNAFTASQIPCVTLHPWVREKGNGQDCGYQLLGVRTIEGEKTATY